MFGDKLRKINMPLYSYQCAKCGKKEDLLKKVDDADTTSKCTVCGSEMARIFDATNTRFELKGKGWYKTDGKY
jgi:putative FmdB family regulatory protein